ncbi:MAG: ribosome small subunit-dependent GTPase A [Bacteroidetes bacterium]|nr:ribosome small subunit-dependent GTPase A [Bacteroidota bacterium]MBL6943588.1 ribosome small subunit-dependent GTPase A [Bacteroidales bacterium]
MIKTFEGRVTKSTGSWYSVMLDTGKTVNCRLKGLFRSKGIRATNPIAVGDVVDGTISDDDQTGVIVNIHQRKNYLIRKATKLSKSTHIIAANVDQVVIIVSLIKPRTSTGFIDRILSTAEAYHIPSVIIFNKYDLYDEKTVAALEFLKTTYQNVGYNCLVTSVPEKLRLTQLKEILNGKISLLAGHSGVGKSALINAVDSSLQLKTAEISTFHNKGIHTTTFANMFYLNFGGWVIDTPGIKEFGLVEFEKVELGQRFPEIRNLMHQCRFSNCLHVNEPGCAVTKAVTCEDIAEFRYNNYFNMLNSI